jgi:hypothetical protein
LETVHFYQNLVERLFPLVVAATKTGTALTSHRINLVEEHDAWGISLRLGEQVAHPSGSHADVKFYELGARDAEKRHTGFAGNSTGEERLAGSRRAE